METRLDLTEEDFRKIQRHEIGHGTDGVVYKYHRGYLIKVYRQNIEEPSVLEKTKEYDRENPPKFALEKSNLTFYFKSKDDVDRIRVNKEKAMEYIHEKQLKVVKTHLPKKLVYVDGKFVGVLLKKVKGIQIHKLTGAPFKIRKKIALEVIEAVKELLENNIYHEDLGNSPFSESPSPEHGIYNPSYGHSHVLLNPFTMKINVIDLEGKSTIYTNYIDKAEEEISLTNLTTLLFEFLFQVDEREYDLDGYANEENYYVQRELIKHGIDDETAKRIAANGFKTIEEAEEVVKRSR